MSGNMETGRESGTLGGQIVRAGFAVGIAHVLFKLVSVVQVMVLGRYLPPGSYDVVYAFAFEGCIFSLFLIGEEVIGPTFLPVFMREMDTRGERRAWDFANVVLTVQLLLLLVIALCIMCFPGTVVRLLTAWTPEGDEAKFRLGREAVVWLAPALVCLSLGSTTYMILNGYKRFFLAAFGDASWKICVLVFVLVGMGLFGMGYRAVIFGLLAGSVAKLGTHLIGLARPIRFLRLSLRGSGPALRTMLILMLPLVGGIVFAKVRDIYNNVTILSRLEAEGLMQANSFGRKIYQTIGWLVPYAFSIAMFPFFCEMVDRDDREKFAEILTNSGRMLLSVFIPLALVIVVLARPFASLLFKGGEFTDRAVTLTSVSVACYTLVLPAAAVEFLLMQAFFANRKTLAVTAVGVVYSALSMLISYVGVVVYGARGLTAIAVIALGFTLRGTLKSITLTWLLKRTIACFPFRPTAFFLSRVAVVATACAAAAWGVSAGLSRVMPGEGKLSLMLRLAAAGGAAAAGFVAGSWILRVQEPFEMFQWALRKVSGRRPRSGPRPAA